MNTMKSQKSNLMGALSFPPIILALALTICSCAYIMHLEMKDRELAKQMVAAVKEKSSAKTEAHEAWRHLISDYYLLMLRSANRQPDKR